MIEDINKRQKKKFMVALLSVVIVSIVVFLLALMVGQYGFISPIDLAKIIVNLFGADFELPASYENIIQFIRLPRTLAAFLVGGALSISGLVYQNTFNNKLISPDILGVSAGACVGAGIAILMSMNSGMISVFAFQEQIPGGGRGQVQYIPARRLCCRQKEISCAVPASRCVGRPYCLECERQGQGYNGQGDKRRYR